MNIIKSLSHLGLSPVNSVVIGSGILGSLGLGESNDIDVVTTPDIFARLENDSRFTKSKNHGRHILTYELFEIGTGWRVLGKDQTLDDLVKQSVVIDGVRYVTIEFLLSVKKSWLQDDDVQQKDIDDVELIEKYLATKNKTFGDIQVIMAGEEIGSVLP